MLKNINLQLFAEDEELDLGDEELEKKEDKKEEKEDSEEQEQESDEQQDDDSEEEKPVKKDKVTAAIIKQKQENKKLRDKLAEYERNEQERIRKENDSKLFQKYIENGMDEDDAAEKIAGKNRQEKLEREVTRLKYTREADKLEIRYPDIHDNLDSFISIVEASNGAITLSELCRAKLDTSSDFEKRTKTEQEMILNKNKAASKKIVTGESKQNETIKFTPDDEEAYKFYAAKNPGKTRKDYQEILNMKRG